MYIKRILETEVRKYLNTKEIVAIVGPRQSGKTTLMKQLSQDLRQVVFVDFEDRETLALFTEDLPAFIELYVKGNQYLFIDEFQYAKEGGKQLKYLYDHHDIKIVVSGSSVSELSIQSIKFLVGRILVFTLYPLSFEEYLSYRDPKLHTIFSQQRNWSAPLIEKILPLFHEFCVYGGYPRVVLAEDREEKAMILKNIYNTYLLKEIKEILNIADEDKLRRLVHALALQIGGLVNYRELCDVTGCTYAQLKEYLYILEKTFVCIRAQPFSTNKRTELVKTPKIFFLDNGFRNSVIKSMQSMKERPDRGKLYENYAASELTKHGLEVRYWRTKAKAEVDFIIEREGSLVPVEIKSLLSKPKMTQSFQSFLAKYKPETGLILSERLSAEKRNIRFRPIFSVAHELL